MPTVNQILNYEPYSKLKEAWAIMSYIDDHLLEHFQVNNLEKDYVSEISPALIGNVSDIVIYDFFRKKKNITYSPKIFEKEMKFVETFCSYFAQAIKFVDQGSMNSKHKASLIFFHKELDELLKNKNTEYELIPINHYLLFARVSQWFRFNIMRQLEYVDKAHKSFDDDMQNLAGIIPVIDARFNLLLKDLTFKNCLMSHALGDQHVQGECDLVIDDAIIDNTCMEDMKITSKWLFQMFFYIYLYSEVGNNANPIKKIGFLNWRCNCFHVKDCDMSQELKGLFANLYLRVKEIKKTR